MKLLFVPGIVHSQPFSTFRILSSHSCTFHLRATTCDFMRLRVARLDSQEAAEAAKKAKTQEEKDKADKSNALWSFVYSRPPPIT